ncbi:hypothetical protein D5086_016494 [Populus alba]|uniref:Uncharacterized protein n=1 Tax=Populus alba TaxID=43335 RepID=A0ACC4BUB3_POPAL
MKVARRDLIFHVLIKGIARWDSKLMEIAIRDLVFHYFGGRQMGPHIPCLLKGIARWDSKMIKGDRQKGSHVSLFGGIARWDSKLKEIARWDLILRHSSRKVARRDLILKPFLRKALEFTKNSSPWASFPARVASKSDKPYTNMFTCNPFIPENGPVGSKKLETAPLSGSKWPPRAVRSLELPNLAARGAHFERTVEMLPN